MQKDVSLIWYVRMKYIVPISEFWTPGTKLCKSCAAEATCQVQLHIVQNLASFQLIDGFNNNTSLCLNCSR